jgi:hypothetical protein
MCKLSCEVQGVCRHCRDAVTGSNIDMTVVVIPSAYTGAFGYDPIATA